MEDLKNKFFQLALSKAASFLASRNRLIGLLANLGTKVHKINWKEIKAEPIKEAFAVLGRLAKAYALGQYKDVSWKSMLLVVGAILYFINPLDLIPDIVPMLGLTDDFAVLAAVYSAVASELSKFLAWESSRSV